MKILILTDNYPRRNALNHGVFIHQQVKALQLLGAECHVLLLHNWFPPFGLHRFHPMWRTGHQQRNIFFEEYEGIKIHSVPSFIRMPSRVFRENAYDRAARSLHNYISGNRELRNADWIYAQFLTDNGFIGAKLKNSLQMKLAAIARGDDVHAWPENDPSLVQHIRYVFEHADLMLANNKRLAKDALHWAGSTIPKFRIAYNGVEYRDYERQDGGETALVALRQRYNIPDGKKVLLCIARGEYLKGWNELLVALSECGQAMEEWVLLAITDNINGRFSVAIPEIVEKEGLGDMVRVNDFVPHSEVKALYHMSDAFILPSYNEGLSNAVLEAMSSGLWVITTDVGGHAEIIEHGVSGFLIQPRSKEEIKKSLIYLAANFQHRKDEIRAGALKAMQQYGDYRKNAAVLLEYFMEGLR